MLTSKDAKKQTQFKPKQTHFAKPSEALAKEGKPNYACRGVVLTKPETQFPIEFNFLEKKSGVAIIAEAFLRRMR
jgi:hypothetical protein